MLVDELTDPLPFSWVVPGLGIGLLVAVGLWFLFIVFWRPRARVPEATTTPAAPVAPGKGDDPFAAARTLYLERIDEIEQRFRAGELDVRGLHLALSATVRDFGEVRAGVRARYMTLRELREAGAASEIEWLIRSYYHPSFSRAGSKKADADEALEGARTVVIAW